ncbi:hypothetical protein FDB30_04210 [Clostridium botulinum]|uniref:Uncharacterized protein n=1 Tax=Clostridium botulinum TaxID=1491 RepID=A0A846JPF3_CLOBO|nr:hypothetical protein [Clostridium botulinum]KAI3346241.1 hypothetical protein CIT18_14465 [Clostridium botulinum]KOM88856.1 hypothetical protein ACP51_06420 [Clostridium botulinum]KOR57693.1 hypothetical protein ADT22_13110 [Clostridium botulinum]NFE13025.1 hypothetical protein [Clostridium botulinum]NFE85649.1 hypothetical protein [Clostridium botulinum]
MRHGIRQKLLDTVKNLKGCYEPSVPNKDTLKPYAVVLQGSDDDNGEVVGFKRTIEIWLYEDKTTFKNLDKLVEEVIKTLDMQVIEDLKTNETFTCIFNGTIGQDLIDEEWQAITRGLRFTVISLHEENEINTDKWLDALSDYTKDIIKLPIYLNNWKQNFEVPSILWRVQNQEKERISNSLIKESKTLICHIASTNKNEINKLLEDIEDKLVTDLKIPLDLADRRYLTIESIEEDREADMLSKGQLTVKFSRRKMIERKEIPKINKIYGSGILKE